MDTMSAGATVTFAIECYEEGILTKDDPGGLELTRGNAGAIMAPIDKMVSRHGIGDILANGSLRAARKIGKGAEQFVVHAGG